MATITYRTTENRAERLKTLAGHMNVSVNKLIDEMATYALASYESENRFRARAARGSAAAGLAMLDELDAHYGDTPDAYSFEQPNAQTSYGLHEKEQTPFDHMDDKD